MQQFLFEVSAFFSLHAIFQFNAITQNKEMKNEVQMTFGCTFFHLNITQGQLEKQIIPIEKKKHFALF